MIVFPDALVLPPNLFISGFKAYSLLFFLLNTPTTALPGLIRRKNLFASLTKFLLIAIDI
jgi:hypothetical protein